MIVAVHPANGPATHCRASLGTHSGLNPASKSTIMYEHCTSSTHECWLVSVKLVKLCPQCQSAYMREQLLNCQLINQGIIDCKGTETRQLFSHMFAMAKKLKSCLPLL